MTRATLQLEAKATVKLEAFQVDGTPFRHSTIPGLRIARNLMFRPCLAMNSGITLWLPIYESTAIDSGRVSWKPRGSALLPTAELSV